MHLTSQLRTSSMRPMQASRARLMSLRFWGWTTWSYDVSSFLNIWTYLTYTEDQSARSCRQQGGPWRGQGHSLGPALQCKTAQAP